MDIKTPEGVEVVLRPAEHADVFIEGFRPGVAERMGLGPDHFQARNPAHDLRLGQEGPLAPAAGHDINYLSVAGALEPIGRARERPVPPLNLVGGFAGGGMLLALGVLAALPMTQLFGMRSAGMWPNGRGSNVLNGGAPFYDT